MHNISIFLVLTVLIIAVQGFPTVEDDIGAAITANKWDDVQRILKEQAKQTFDWSPVLSADVKNLKPESGGHVYGESEFTYHSSSNLNGRKSQQSGGHKVVNQDGVVTEYYFQP